MIEIAIEEGTLKAVVLCVGAHLVRASHRPHTGNPAELLWSLGDRGLESVRWVPSPRPAFPTQNPLPLSWTTQVQSS